MKQTINFQAFEDAFRAYGRLDQEDGKGGNFTLQGLRVLFYYLTDIEEDTGEEMELDVIALCFEYSEETPEDIAQYHNIDLSDCDADEEGMRAAQVEDKVKGFLEYRSTVCGVTPDGKIVYQQF